MTHFPNDLEDLEAEEIAWILQIFIESYVKFGRNYEEFNRYHFLLKSNLKTEKIVEYIINNNIKNLSAEDFENITKDGSLLMSYGSTFLEYGIEHGAIDFLNLALQIFKKRGDYFEKNTHDYAKALTDEGAARRELANLGIDSIENLRGAIKLYQKAREEGFVKNTHNYAKTLMYEGIARSDLADNEILSCKIWC